ncbi:hypothetical protein JHK85_009006 [Glycine max]|nr:hypothetical protein JHK85_009006 [Glycine max]
MATRRCIQLFIYFLATCSSLADSVSSPVPVNKFLMQSYYDRYTILHDSDFDNFMSQAIPSGSSCGFVLRLSDLKRTLIGEVFSDVAVFGDTNLELPSFLSNRSAVEIHLLVDPNILQEPTDIKMELPLHARYQPLNESGYSTVEFGAPDMLVRCGTKGKVENHYCFFKLEKDDANLYGPHTVWRIPSGIKAHADLVSAATFIAALLSTLAIVVASLYYSNS